MQGVVSSSLDSCQQLEVLAQKGVTRAGERLKGDLVGLIGLSIEEPELSVEHPGALLPQFGVL